MTLNYETRIKQLDAKKSDTVARYAKATRKAKTDLTFAIGELILNCVDDWRGFDIAYFDDFVQRKSDNFAALQRLEVIPGEPGKYINEWKKSKKG